MAISALSISAEPLQENQTHESAQAVWVDHYDTIEEMVTDSDVVIYGKVVAQTQEQSVDLIFTRSTIEILMLYKGAESLQTLEILQTGGSLNGIITPSIEGVPLYWNIRNISYIYSGVSDYEAV